MQGLKLELRTGGEVIEVEVVEELTLGWQCRIIRNKSSPPNYYEVGKLALLTEHVMGLIPPPLIIETEPKEAL